MLLRKTPLSKRLTADEIESKLKDVVRIKSVILYINYCQYHPTLSLIGEKNKNQWKYEFSIELFINL